MRRHLSTPYALLIGALALGGLAAVAHRSAADENAPAESTEPKAVEIDVNDCMTCHESTVAGMQHTYHATVDKQCAACHGNLSEHLSSVLSSGEPGPVISVKRLTPTEANTVCLGCHDKHRQAAWEGGVHDRKGVACITCHSVHNFKSAKAQLKEAKESDNCFQCHKQIRSKTMRISHHPIREGLMGCSSCHDPHNGTRRKMIKADWTNELCYTCHTEKRGPFLWEHAPVREDCLNCHDPHGSNNEKLLVARQPYLCQRCHLNTRHPGTLYDLRNAATGPSVSNRAVEHACRNCHQNIHGSNAPSGPYLGR
jgi:DmsE family decaheme c-type cytochrome